MRHRAAGRGVPTARSGAGRADHAASPPSLPGCRHGGCRRPGACGSAGAQHERAGSVQDALATPRGTLTLQGTSVYTRDDFNRKGRDLLELGPTVKIGAAKGLQLDFTVPYAVGNQSSANQGYGATDF